MKLTKTAKQIEDSCDFIDVDGTVWAIEKRKGHKNYGQWFKKAQNPWNGYMYCGIYRLSLGRPVSMRVNRLVAKAFVPNDDPDHKVFVAHRNNIRTDNRVENLYWATPSENTQQAFDDKLIVNDKSWDDSQSMHVYQYETRTNKLIAKYGSVSEAERQTGIPKPTILRQCKYNRPVRKDTYFRFQGDESIACNEMVRAYDIYTDELIGLYFNTSDASRQTGISAKTIATDLKNNRKPKNIFQERTMYFLRRDL